MTCRSRIITGKGWRWQIQKSAIHKRLGGKFAEPESVNMRLKKCCDRRELLKGVILLVKGQILMNISKQLI